MVAYDNGDAYVVPVKDGVFETYLPHGEYVLESYVSRVSDSQLNAIRLMKEFVVQDGKVVDLEVVLNRVSVQLKYNLINDLKNDEQTRVDIDGGSVYYQLPSMPNMRYPITFTGDSFDVYLPDGVITFSGYELNNGLVQQDMSTTVNLAGENEALMIEIQASNVFGTFVGFDEDIFRNGYLRVQALKHHPQYRIYASSNTADEQFHFYVPPGDYRLLVSKTTFGEPIPDIFTNKTFQVNNEAERLDLQLSYYNIAFEVANPNGVVSGDYMIELQLPGQADVYYLNVYDDEASIYLSTGEYVIKSLFQFNGSYYDVIYKFAESLYFTVSADGEKRFNLDIK